MLRVLMLVLTLGSFNVHAAQPEMDLDTLNEDLSLKLCWGLKLSKEQREAIKTRRAKAKEDAKTYLPAVKAARKALTAVLSDVDSTKAQAEEAQGVLKAASAPLKSIRTAAKLDVAYDIMTAEQRVKLLQCRKKAGDLIRSILKRIGGRDGEELL